MKSYFIPAHTNCRTSNSVMWFEPWFYVLKINFLVPFLSRKPEALATNTNSGDNKPVEEKIEYLQENETALS
jgi:hypothetical protein